MAYLKGKRKAIKKNGQNVCKMDLKDLEIISEARVKIVALQGANMAIGQMIQAEVNQLKLMGQFSGVPVDALRMDIDFVKQEIRWPEQQSLPGEPQPEPSVETKEKSK